MLKIGDFQKQKTLLYKKDDTLSSRYREISISSDRQDGGHQVRFFSDNIMFYFQLETRLVTSDHCQYAELMRCGDSACARSCLQCEIGDVPQ